MRWPEQLVSVPMARVGVVAPNQRLRRVLVETADAGLFEPDRANAGSPISSPNRPTQDKSETEPRLADQLRPAEELEAEGRYDLIRGEEELDRIASQALLTDRCAVVTGWLPHQDLEQLRERIRRLGGAVAELPARRGLVAPTAHVDRRAAGALRPLVSTYATVPYSNLDPTLFAAIAYMLMFGMMFGDVAHGLALVGSGVAAIRSQKPILRRVRPVAPFLLGAGFASVVFGFLYGEAFGPTGLVPTLWLEPLDEPETLLLAGLLGGTCLIAVTFVLGSINRWREGGPAVALYAASGIGGSLLFTGAAAFAGGLVGSLPWLWQAGVVVALLGVALSFVGLVSEAGTGPSAIAQATVEMFDTVLRLGSNVVSFTRLAAFGLTHAVITGVVWDGSASLWDRPSLLSRAAAVLLFVFGNTAAFTLGAMVGAIQALRLEYYEMFSRVFSTEGRPFEPWHLPVERSESS